ncbi:mfs general substrate transporter [Stemphylium lycopersici]|nr:mfs general substrate transporter [Stemphylium lycopersici]
MSVALHSLFDIQPASHITNPEPAYQKNKDKSPQSPRHVGILPDVELEFFAINKDDNDRQPSGSKHSAQDGTQTPKTPNELERSRPATPNRDDTFPRERLWNDDPMTKWRILCCCLIYFCNGINDSVVGALIPYMESYYHISYSIMSLVFVGNAIGFISAAFFTDTILGKIGRAKTLVSAETTQFFFLGYGAAMNLALNNVYCANTHPPSVILGLAHGSYGVGGIVAPIIGTAIASHGIIWSRFYFLLVGLRLCCIAFAAWSFWSFKEDSEDTLLEATTSRQTATEEAVSKLRNLKLALKNKVTIFGALFIFAYQGAEVSISGWFISYLINYRNGDPARVGYVTAGFWGGITLGRFVLTHAAPKIGEKNFVVILTLGTIGLQLLAWLTPNLIGNAVAVCLLGLLLGPVYPCSQTIFSRLIPRHIQTTTIGFIGGAGSSGGAVAPFTTGILAQAAGTWVLHPVCLGIPFTPPQSRIASVHKNPNMATQTIQILSISTAFVASGGIAALSLFDIPIMRSLPASRSLPMIRWLFSRGSHIFPTAAILSSSGFIYLAYKSVPSPSLKSVSSLLQHIIKGRPGYYLAAAALSFGIAPITRFMIPTNFTLIRKNEELGGSRSAASASYRNQAGSNARSADESVDSKDDVSQWKDLSMPQEKTQKESSKEEDKEVDELLAKFGKLNMRTFQSSRNMLLMSANNSQTMLLGAERTVLELLIHIISFLPYEELGNYHAVSPCWNSALKNNLPPRLRPLPDHPFPSTPPSRLEEPAAHRPLPKPIRSLAQDIQHRTAHWLNPALLIDISDDYYFWHDGAYGNLLNALTPHLHPFLTKHACDLVDGIDKIVKGEMGICLRTEINMGDFEEMFGSEGGKQVEIENAKYLTKPLTKSVEIYCVSGRVWDQQYKNVQWRNGNRDWQQRCVRIERERGVSMCDVIDELRGVLKADGLAPKDTNAEVLLEWRMGEHPVEMSAFDAFDRTG